jgi:hypothetical protein
MVIYWGVLPASCKCALIVAMHSYRLGLTWHRIPPIAASFGCIGLDLILLGFVLPPPIVTAALCYYGQRI